MKKVGKIGYTIEKIGVLAFQYGCILLGTLGWLGSKDGLLGLGWVVGFPTLGLGIVVSLLYKMLAVLRAKDRQDIAREIIAEDRLNARALQTEMRGRFKTGEPNASG